MYDMDVSAMSYIRCKGMLWACRMQAMHSIGTMFLLQKFFSVANTCTMQGYWQHGGYPTFAGGAGGCCNTIPLILSYGI